MARPTLATLDDLNARLDTPATNPTQAYARLADASEIVRAYAGEDWIDADGEPEEVPDQIVGVVAQMVERSSRNPGGVTSETAGPFARSFGPEAATRLYLTKLDKLIIRAAVDRGQVGTIPTSRGPLETPPVIDGYHLDPTSVEETDPFSLT